MYLCQGTIRKVEFAIQIFVVPFSCRLSSPQSVLLRQLHEEKGSPADTSRGRAVIESGRAKIVAQISHKFTVPSS